MKFPSILLFTCMVIFGCKNNDSSENAIGENNEQKASENSSKTEKAKDPVAGCYMRVLQRDSFTARLERQGDRISGNLRFDNFEKDASSGPVTGVINDNIIRLIYTFQSEGMTSVMEVYFKTRGDDLIRGVGEMITKNDTLYFKNPDDVQYPANEKWRKLACDL
ncbi:MAG: hypothetical protein ACHQFX_06695 [Chitinophagales bacterium]